MRGKTTILALVGVWACARGDFGDGPDAGDPRRDGGADPIVDAWLPVFTLEAATSLSPGPGLALRTNLPARQIDCEALNYRNVPCGDADMDGLTDAWEDLVLDRLRPMIKFDEGEALMSSGGFVAAIGRVAPVTIQPLEVLMVVIHAYPKDYGGCGLAAHNGDSERVAFRLKAPTTGSPGDIVVSAVYTGAHESTAKEASQTFTTAQLAQLEHENDTVGGQPRWVVYSSEDWHSNFATNALCEASASCNEDCSPDWGADPAEYVRLPQIVNAGEAAAPRVNALDTLGFSGETAWGTAGFCGGLGGTECAGPVRDKLLDDPF